MITCEERKNRLLKANNLMKRLNLNSILVVGNGSVATNEYGFYRYFVDNRVYYHVHVGFSSSGYSYPHFGTGCNGHRH